MHGWFACSLSNCYAAFYYTKYCGLKSHIVVVSLGVFCVCSCILSSPSRQKIHIPNAGAVLKNKTMQRIAKLQSNYVKTFSSKYT